MKAKPIPLGTIRIRAKDQKTVIKTKSGWQQKAIPLKDAEHLIHLYKSHNQYKALIDAKDPTFLKGMLSPDEKPMGARIAFLPDGKKLNAAFSIFAKNLRFHDEDTDVHWDVMFENPSGFKYIYTADKIKARKSHKTHIVDQFAKVLPKLKAAVIKDLLRDHSIYPLALMTMMKTYMRVGNDIYYKAHGHKGLTTLQKKDIKINGNEVIFNYIAKDGVPVTICEKFPDTYVNRLSDLLKEKKRDSFVFSHESGHPLHGQDLKKAIQEYCGKPFFPHIIRSYYADSEVKNFFRTHRTATKQEVNTLLIKIASKLGHKRFNKKENAWVESPKVTVNSYIRPAFVERLHGYYM